MEWLSQHGWHLYESRPDRRFLFYKRFEETRGFPDELKQVRGFLGSAEAAEEGEHPLGRPLREYEVMPQSPPSEEEEPPSEVL